MKTNKNQKSAKTIKRSLTLLLACILCLGTLSLFTGCGEKYPDEAFEVDGVTYRLTSYGTGQLSDKLNGTEETVVLKILDFGDKTEITLPTHYEDYAIENFGGCDKSDKYAPDGNATVNQEQITKITIPEGYKMLYSFAFTQFKGLRELVLPESLESINDSAFYKTERLYSITIPAGVTTIGNAFSDSSIVECRNLSTVGTGVYDYTDENGSTIYESDDFICQYVNSTVYLLEYLGNSEKLTLPTPAPGGAKAYTNVPDTLNYTVCSYAFKNNVTLKSVSIPTGFTNIKSYAFKGCTALTEVNFLSNRSKTYTAENWCDDESKITINE